MALLHKSPLIPLHMGRSRESPAPPTGGVLKPVLLSRHFLPIADIMIVAAAPCDTLAPTRDRIPGFFPKGVL